MKILATLLLSGVAYAQIPAPSPGGSGSGNTTSSTLTPPYIPKATGANSIGNSALHEDGGTLLVYDGSSGFALFNGPFLLGDDKFIKNGSGAQTSIGASSGGRGWIDTMATAFTLTSGFMASREVGQTHVEFSPTSGSASYAGLLVNPATNATSTGTAYGLVVAPKFTAMTGGTTKLVGFGTSTGAEGVGYTELAFVSTAGQVNGTSFGSATNCSSSASPAVCGSSASGSAAIVAGTNPTLVINTTAVTANSQIQLTPDSSLGTKLSATCNTTLPTALVVTARTAGTSFTIQAGGTFTTNPVCVSYTIVN